MTPSSPRRLLALCCLLLGTGTAMAASNLYGYTDADGTTHLSNVPDSDREPYRLLLRVPSESSARSKSEYPQPRSFRLSQGRSPFTNEIQSAASTFGLEPALLNAVIAVESNHNPAALSPKGAMGLMQLMPGTSQRFGVSDPWHPEQNILGGARYLSELLTLFNQDLTLALAAYNAGEQAVIRHGRRIPPYPETRSYVTKVVGLYRQTPPAPKPATTKSRAARSM